MTQPITAAAFFAVLRSLPETAPITAELCEEDEFTKDGLLSDLVQLGEMETTTAQAIFESDMLSPQDVLWLAEQLGIGERTLRKAFSAAVELESDAEQDRVIRAQIPWREIEPRLLEAFRSLRERRAELTAISTPPELLDVVELLPADQPRTDDFSRAWLKSPTPTRERDEVWYSTQKQHWMGWLSAYDGPGAYNRKNHRRSAEYVYNHIVNPQMLIYLAEAASVDPKLVAAASRAALAPGASTMSSMSARIRTEIPWNVIESHLLATVRHPNLANTESTRRKPHSRRS